MKAWTALKSAAKRVGQFAAGIFDDALAAVGIATVSRGVYLIYEPAAYIIAGLAMLVIAMLRAARAASAANQSAG
jgi:hypothetical protein